MQSDILKTILSPICIKDILIEHYNLKNINDVFLIKASFNDVYKIVTKENQYIFKIFHHAKKINDLKFEIEYMLYLQNNNIVVSYPFRAISSQYIISINYLEGVRLTILTNFIKGNELTYEKTYDAYIYGRNIAQLHIVSKNFSVQAIKKEYNICQILINSKNVIENFLSKYYPDKINFFSEFTNKLLKVIKILNLTQQYCHNDLHGGNVKKENANVFFLISIFLVMDMLYMS